MVPPSGTPPSWRGGYEALTPQLHPNEHKGVTHSARGWVGKGTTSIVGNYSVGEEIGNHGVEKVGILSLKKRKPSRMRHHDYLQRHEELLCSVDKE